MANVSLKYVLLTGNQFLISNRLDIDCINFSTSKMDIDCIIFSISRKLDIDCINFWISQKVGYVVILVAHFLMGCFL